MGRVIGVFSSREQASAAMDDLENKGLHRRDMIISELGEQPSDMTISIQNETDSLTDNEGFTEMNSINGASGVVVAVEIPIYRRGAVAEAMRQRGATNLRFD